MVASSSNFACGILMRMNVEVMLDVVDLTCDWKKRGSWELMVLALNSG